MKYLILGASAAGINCARTLSILDPKAEITVVSKDEKIYSRCMLHHIISGERGIEELNFAGEDFFEKPNLNWIKGKEINAVYPAVKSVILEDSTALIYDKLLIATGASFSVPPVKNLRQAKGVYGLRNIEDAERIKEESQRVTDVAVLGAGLVGIDAVVGLISKGLNISLLELADRILPLQLDQMAAVKYEELFKKAGVNIYTCERAEEAIVDDSNHIKALKTSSGRIINCQMVIVAAGVTPNLSFIQDNELKIDRGIVTDSRCKTNIEDVYAAGDVCGANAIWPLAVKQGITAAYNMAGIYKSLDDSFGLRNSLNFMGVQTVSIGLIERPDTSYNIYVQQDQKSYKKIIEKDGILYGAIFQGDISYCGTVTYMIKNKINIAHINKNIFDIDYSDFYSVRENGTYAYVV